MFGTSELKLPVPLVVLHVNEDLFSLNLILLNRDSAILQKFCVLNSKLHFEYLLFRVFE